MRWTIYSLVAAAIVLSSCADVRQERLGDGQYEISYAEPLGGPNSANGVLSWRAKEICPNGYEKLREWREAGPDSTGDRFTWRIRCL